MATTANLLQQAYQYIDSGNCQAAVDILEALLNADPTNVEAWEVCMQISKTCNELDELCDRVLRISEINVVDRESILDYYYFLRQKKKLGQVCEKTQTEIRLEVVDYFCYSLKSNNSPAREDEQIVTFERRLALFLDQALFIPHIALMAICFNLIAINNNLGYWAVLLLMLIAFLGKLKRMVSMTKVNQSLSSNY